jgi:hypothetical protein
LNNGNIDQLRCHAGIYEAISLPAGNFDAEPGASGFALGKGGEDPTWIGHRQAEDIFDH